MSKKEKVQHLIHRTLGPLHIWALGVGVVMVGDFMGWNLTIVQGGSVGSLIGIWTMAMMFVGLIMMNAEMSSVLPNGGGQYAMAKYLLGPLAAFNIALMMVLEFTMLEAADALVVGQLLQSLDPDISTVPFVILTLLVFAYVNYHGSHGTLTLNFIIAAVAFASIVILLMSTNCFNPQQTLLHLKELTDGIPYGFLGVMAAMQFSIWFFMGIEGTALAAGECRSPNRSLPVGAMVGLATLLVSGLITWFVCSGLMDTGTLGSSVYPLYEAALATGKLMVAVVLFIGSLLACLASVNGCINDASHAWHSMSEDGLLPSYFGKLHPKYGSPHRAIILLLPLAMIFAFSGMLDQLVTFAILSALLAYVLTCVMMFRFRKMYPLDQVKRGYVAPLYPLPMIITAVLACLALFGMHLTYAVSMISGVLFYLLASVWFLKRRAKHIDQKAFLRPGLEKWGRPKNF